MRDASLNGSAFVPIAACTGPTPATGDGEVIGVFCERDSSLNGSAHVPIAACTGPTPETGDGIFEERRVDAFINGSAFVLIAACTGPTPEIEDGDIERNIGDIERDAFINGSACAEEIRTLLLRVMTSEKE